MKTKLIKDQKDLFKYIDPDFKNWNVDEGIKESKTLMPKKLEKDATFKDMFISDINAVSQESVIDWVEKNKDTILSTGFCYFFLLKNSEGDLFVARVFKSDGALDVGVNEFSRDYVWRAERGNVFVFPQQTLDTSDTSGAGRLDASVPLTLPDTLTINGQIYKKQ